MGTQYATERLVAGDQSPTDSRRHVRISTNFPTTYIEDHETAKIALAICHRDEDKTADKDKEVARTEEAAMINAAARCKLLF